MVGWLGILKECCNISNNRRGKKTIKEKKYDKSQSKTSLTSLVVSGFLKNPLRTGFNPETIIKADRGKSSHQRSFWAARKMRHTLFPAHCQSDGEKTAAAFHSLPLFFFFSFNFFFFFGFDYYCLRAAGMSRFILKCASMAFRRCNALKLRETGKKREKEGEELEFLKKQAQSAESIEFLYISTHAQ